jgi:hypothetical protein
MDEDSGLTNVMAATRARSVHFLELGKLRGLVGSS